MGLNKTRPSQEEDLEDLTEVWLRREFLLKHLTALQAALTM